MSGFFPSNTRLGKIESKIARSQRAASEAASVRYHAEQFALTNPPPKPEKWQGDVSPKCRQRVLLSGMSCLEGQQDLFQVDGS